VNAAQESAQHFLEPVNGRAEHSGAILLPHPYIFTYAFTAIAVMIK